MSRSNGSNRSKGKQRQAKEAKARNCLTILLLLLPLLLLLLSVASRAQMVFETGIGPDAFSGGPKEKKESRPDVQPFAQALTLYFSSPTLAQVGISTSSPAKELTNFMYHGYYKQEIIQLILMSKESGKSFKEFAKERKNGKRFEELAGKAKIDFSDIFGGAVEIRKIIDAKFLPRVESEIAASSETVPHLQTHQERAVSQGTASLGGDSAFQTLITFPDGWSVKAAVARTPGERVKGLQHRESLGPDEGMLFVFEDENSRTFWMKNTWIALDIVYIGSNMYIKKIFHRVPRSYPDTPDSKVAAVTASGMYVLEVAAGLARRHKLEPGRKLDFKLE